MYLTLESSREEDSKQNHTTQKRDDFTFSITETPTSNEWIADH
jgi:hypothetical protein